VAARPIGLRVEGHDFQIDHVAELEQVVVGAHVGMALPKRDIEIKASSNVQDPSAKDGAMTEMWSSLSISRRMRCGGRLDGPSVPASRRPIHETAMPIHRWFEDYVFEVPGFLPADRCDALIAQANGSSSRKPPSARPRPAAAGKSAQQ